jgi:hypothetical protein
MQAFLDEPVRDKNTNKGAISARLAERFKK